MPHQRAGTKYWQITVAGVRQSSETTDYQAAKALEHKLNHEVWEHRNLGAKFGTWDQACLDWFKRNAHIRSIDVSRYYSNFWETHLSGKQLKGITGDLIREIYSAHRPANATEAVPQNTTANLYLAFVVKIMRHAGIVIKVDYFPAPEGREEWLSGEQWVSLKFPTEDWRQLATFSLATGLREGNVIGLQWEWIKHGDFLLIPANSTKTKVPYGVPLNKTALGVLKARKDMPVVHARNVFTLSGKEITKVHIHRGWKRILKASGVPHMPYHSLRHTFASWMVQNGVPFEFVARLGQWKQAGMVHRYSHLDVESVRPYAERFDTILTQFTQPKEKLNAVS